jgi:hypothetical protein
MTQALLARLARSGFERRQLRSVGSLTGPRLLS